MPEAVTAADAPSTPPPPPADSSSGTSTNTTTPSQPAGDLPSKAATGNLPPPDSKLAEPKDAPEKPEGESKQTRGETKAEAVKRKYQLKVDGQLQDLELGDDEIAVRLQKAMGAEKRMQQAAETVKKVEAWLENFKKDPFAAAKDPLIGVDLEKAAIERLKREYEESQLAEPERKLRQLERELQEVKAREEAAKAEQQRKAQEEMETRVFQEMEREFSEALSGEALPRNKHTIYMMAEIMRANVENGVELTPKQVAAEVNERLREITSHVLKEMKGEQLVKYLGDNVAKEILRYSIAKVKPPESKPFESPKDLPKSKEPVVDDDDEDEYRKREREKHEQYQKAKRFFSMT